MSEAKVDLIYNDQNNQIQVEGAVANTFANAPGGLHINNFRPFIGNDGRTYVNRLVNNQMSAVPVMANAALRRDEWKLLDEAVLKVSRERLGGVDDLISRGLTYNMTNAMGRTVFEYHDMNDPGSAGMSMDAIQRGANDAPNYTANYIPLPIIHADVTYNKRLLEVSRNMGEALDVTMIEAATRRVLEKREDLLFTSTSYTYGGGTIYSYLNHPNVNSVSITVNWDNVAKTGADIVNQVIAMKTALIGDKNYGPFQLYVPTAYDTILDKDYSTSYTKTIRQRILEIEGISGVKVIDHLTANNVVMVQMTSNVVRLLNGFAPTLVQWETQGGLVLHFKIMCIQVPQIRADQNGNSGVVLCA